MRPKLILLKLVIYLFIVFFLPVSIAAQRTDSLLVKTDSVSAITIIKKDSAEIKKDSLQLIAVHFADSLLHIKDSLKAVEILNRFKYTSLLSENKKLNYSGKPFAMVNYMKKQYPDDLLFYVFLIVIGIIAFLRFFYIRYFTNLFQVFFNTSLRQGQLTDQLLQAKLPSLFFNIVSVINGGLFIYFLLQYFKLMHENQPLKIIGICIVALAIIYFIKFIILKFIGWVTGSKEITNTYIFIIFLINKILGILLLPFIIVMAFSTLVLVKAAVIIALLLTTLMFLMRFYRSYGLLQHQLNFNRLHFCMYIAGIEILPVLLIYKALILLLTKTL